MCLFLYITRRELWFFSPVWSAFIVLHYVALYWQVNMSSSIPSANVESRCLILFLAIHPQTPVEFSDLPGKKKKTFNLHKA